MHKTKRFKQILLSVCVAAVLSFTISQPVFAMTESEIQAQGIAFGMYHAAQYAAPEGNYTTVQAADGSSWYKQYASRQDCRLLDAVDKTPYMAPDGSIAYKESIVKKMPQPPKRRERM